MIEVGINQRWTDDGQEFTRMIGLLRIDENDPDGEVEILQTLDGRTLAAVMKAMRDIAKDQRKAAAQFGAPES